MTFGMRSLARANINKAKLANKNQCDNHGTIHAPTLESLGRNEDGSTANYYIFWNSQVKINSKTLVGKKGMIEFEKVDKGFSAILSLTGDGGLMIND